ncbi:MAG: SRPBCC family protein [Dehalococcoidia bacterium]|jgi:mxaD protein|nr:SRPBCC family protein [Dehalococcoidia bacterium]
MAVFAESIDIAASPDDVWAVAGDVQNISGWLPFIGESRTEGDYRHCETEAGPLRERILVHDDEARRYEYTILEAPMEIEFIHATVQVTPTADGAHVEWSTLVTPDELVDAFSPIYRAGLENMKRQLES